MTLLQAFVLGIVQGLTEFLPISSSAHLILVPKIFDWPDQGLHFDIAANTGTLLAVMVYFRRDLRAILAAMAGALGPTGIAAIWRAGWTGTSFAGGPPPSESLAADVPTAAADGQAQVLRQARLGWGLLLATLPAGLAGLLIHDWVAGGARNLRLIGIELVIFALVLWAADHLATRRTKAGLPTRPVDAMRFPDVLVIGAAQALALLPGTSRSGITMSAGVFRGLSREAAARFSFLLSVPVGILVAAKDGWDIVRGAPLAGSFGAMVVVVVVSALSGLVVIHWLLGWLRRRSLGVFVAYRLVVGVALLLLAA